MNPKTTLCERSVTLVVRRLLLLILLLLITAMLGGCIYMLRIPYSTPARGAKAEAVPQTRDHPFQGATVAQNRR